MTTIFVINGSAGVGKDTFCRYASQYLATKRFTAVNVSTVDKVKKAGMELGWDGVKDEKGRKFLSDLKEISGRYDGPINYISKYLEVYKPDAAFVHIREPDEIAKFLKKYPAAITVLVKDGKNNIIGNDSDDNVDNYAYDYHIENTETKEILRDSACNLMKLTMTSFTQV